MLLENLIRFTKKFFMKKILLFSSLISFHAVFSQVTMSGNKLLKNGQTYKMSQYQDVFKNPEAASYFKKARTNSTVGSIFAYTGGFSLGFGLSAVLFGPKKQVYGSYGSQYEVKADKSVAWLVTGIGAGLIGIGIPFALAADKNAKKAMKLKTEDLPLFILILNWKLPKPEWL